MVWSREHLIVQEDLPSRLGALHSLQEAPLTHLAVLIHQVALIPLEVLFIRPVAPYALEVVIHQVGQDGQEAQVASEVDQLLLGEVALPSSSVEEVVM